LRRRFGRIPAPGKHLTPIAMLAEKFFLLIEALLRRSGDRYANGAPKIVSNSPHVPVQLSPGK
jgi:hypothetical protein